MERKTVWVEETRVKSYETDFLYRWKPACFFQHMQEAATNHASHLGFDYTVMFAQDMIWVLTRMKLKIYEFPRLREAVKVRTWPKGIQQKLFFMRDFQFSKPDGGLYAVATSAWLLMNVSARRMLLPQNLNGDLPDNGGMYALDEPLEKISPGALEEQFRTETGYSAVDLMDHVNNARYIEWVMDCFPQQTHREQKLDWIQINYSNEIKPGECVAISSGQAEGGDGLWYVQGNNLTSPARAFDAAVKWSS